MGKLLISTICTTEKLLLTNKNRAKIASFFEADEEKTSAHWILNFFIEFFFLLRKSTGEKKRKDFVFVFLFLLFYYLRLEKIKVLIF
jgi:hypothetical protein